MGRKYISHMHWLLENLVVLLFISLLICNSSRQAILLNCMLLHKLTKRIHIGTKLVLCRHTHTHTHTHTYTHTHTHARCNCIFSFSLPVGLLAGQVGGWVAYDYGVTCAYKWCGIMYIFEHWRPKMGQIMYSKTRQNSSSKLH